MFGGNTDSISCAEADRERIGTLSFGMTLRSMTLAAAIWLAFFVQFAGTGLAGGTKVLLKNEIPYGERQGALMAQGSKISGLLCVESHGQQDLQVELSVRVPHPLTAGTDDRRLSASEDGDGEVLYAVFPLRIEGEKWFSSVTFTIPQETLPGEYVVRTVARVQSSAGVETVEQVARLRVVSRDVVPSLFQIGDLLLPCNEKGEPEDRQEPNTVLIKGKKTFWQGLVEDRKQSSRLDTKPSTYLTVPVRNTGPHKAIVLVRMDVLDPTTGERVPGFELPYAAEHGDTLGEVAIYQVVEMNPESEERVVLPFYVSEESVRPGIYTARIRAILFGTDIEAGRRELAVKVVGVRWLPALMTALALSTALAGMVFSYCQRKRYFEMKSRELILIALFGTVMFAVVTIPGTLLLHAAHIILGPLSFLVTGFFHEILFYILLVSLVVLIPRVGAVSLVVAVRFLLSSFVLGEFSPISLIYYSTTATCLEAAVYLLGLSRPSKMPISHSGAIEGASVPSQAANGAVNALDDRATAPPRLFSRKKILVSAVILGVTDVFLSFVFFNLSMFFYRLYYATWYLAAYLIIDGFLFTLIAVPFGFKLGGRLKVTASV
jgi:hypothetical protein